MKYKILYTIMISGNLLMACKDVEPRKENISIIENSVQVKDIPFTIAKRYFVNNTVENIDKLKIDTQEDFDKFFGMATVMGENGTPTAIDFSRQYVIALIKPETDFTTELTPVSLQKNEKETLLFSYKNKVGEKQSYTTRPCLIIIVDKKHDGKTIELREL